MKRSNESKNAQPRGAEGKQSQPKQAGHRGNPNQPRDAEGRFEKK